MSKNSRDYAFIVAMAALCAMFVALAVMIFCICLTKEPIPSCASQSLVSDFICVQQNASPKKQAQGDDGTDDAVTMLLM
jgi:ABC-type phosphate transport system permease subunit